MTVPATYSAFVRVALKANGVFMGSVAIAAPTLAIPGLRYDPGVIIV